MVVCAALACVCVCIYSMCVCTYVFMKEAGAKPGLTEERWEELNSSRQQPGSCEEGETQKVTSYFCCQNMGQIGSG